LDGFVVLTSFGSLSAGIFDGHTGNLASKYVASFLYGSILRRIENIDIITSEIPNWKVVIKEEVSKAFVEIHQRFLDAISLVPHIAMDQSGTTATVAVVSPETAVIASLGDSRAVLSSLKDGNYVAVRLTKDHTASDPIERANVEAQGGRVVSVNGVDRVNGTLVVTRSIGDANLASTLSQTPDVIVLSKREMKALCGDLPKGTEVPCFIILASDGLWGK
jgi:protein phosphatase 1L